MTMQVYESSNLRGTAPGLRDYAEVPLGLRTQCRRFPAEPRQCVGLPPGDARGPGPLLIAAVLDDRLGIEVSARTGAVPADALPFEIGRASCRERGGAQGRAMSGSERSSTTGRACT